ncbi:baseplate wedge protein [Vibrio phage 1.081.O._10N.286.52.C2]|nr:baseplate wedge protein [Vibrio phage 1.081.O._10N.286.52.C2]
MIFSIFEATEYQNVATADIFKNLNYYHKQIIGDYTTIQYTIKGDLRPEQVAYEIYGDSSLYWVILLLNTRVDPFYDWILPNEAVSGNAIYRYQWIGTNEQVHHHVDAEGKWWYNMIEDPENPRTWYNEFDFVENAPEEGQEDYREILYSGVMIPVSVDEYEFNKNERARTILVLDTDDLSTYISSFMSLAGV